MANFSEAFLSKNEEKGMLFIIVSFQYFKRLQILGTIAGTFAEFYRKKYLAMLLFWIIFAAEKTTRNINNN